MGAKTMIFCVGVPGVVGCVLGTVAAMGADTGIIGGSGLQQWAVGAGCTLGLWGLAAAVGCVGAKCLGFCVPGRGSS